MRRSLWILLLGLVFSGGVRGETYPWSDLAWENFRVECKNQTRGSKACEQEICGDRARWPVAVPIGSVKGMAEACKKRLAEEAVRKAEQAKQAEARKQQERQAAQQRMAAEEKRKREAAARRAEAAAQKKAEAEREAHFRAAANRPAQEEPAPFSERTTELGLVFVRLPGGRFRMGCDDPNAKGDAKCWSSEMWSDGKAQHEVEISAPFWLGKYEVTQKQWRAVMGDAPMKQGNSRPALLGDDKPVGNVPYNRVLEFIDRLNAREGRDGSAGHERYRLPTEAEWEYAARAGTQTPWSCGSNARCLNEMGARFNRDWDDGPVAVGQSGRNDWGLYGMHGNVWEWVSDAWSNPRKVTGQGGGVLRDPWVSGDNAASRVLRGGDCYNSARFVRSAYRNDRSPDFAGLIFGFRLALSPGHS